MPERSRVPLPFGGGLDRSTGTMAVEPSAFYDLRNVWLFDGKAEIRRGLYETITFFADETCFHIAAIRSQGLSCLFTYKASTREVKMYYGNGAGTTTSGAIVVWTLPVGAAFPKISTADSYGKLYIAHDEAVIASRQQTRVFDPVAVAITDLLTDFYLPTVPITGVQTFFRGVARHLNYLVGWGYGTENDKDRPEIVRISLPGEPDNWKAEHYAICGQRQEPVIGCATVGQSLVVRKEVDSYEIFGYDRTTFGVRQIDQHYGVAAQRLMVTVGDLNYFWSLDGPRVSSNGPSEDLSTMLDLAGPPPDALAASGATDYGFALYNASQREVLFIFGKWAFVLHLRDESARRWSYRQYGIELAGGGMLYSGTSGPPTGTGSGGGAGGGLPGVAPDAHPEITAATPVGNSQATIDWNNVGTLAGGELGEIWMQKTAPAVGPWTLMKDNIAIAGPTESEAVTGLEPGATYSIAARFKLLGVYTAGYTSSDPSNWPAVSRSTITMPAGLNVPTDVVAAGFCAGTVPRIGYSFTITDGNKTRVQFSTMGNDPAFYTDVVLLVNPASSGDFGIDYDEYYWMRFRHENTAGDDVSPWVVVEVGSMPLGTCG